MVSSMAAEIPEEYLDGVVEITVSPRTVAHPDRPDVYTLGECIPLVTSSDEPDALRSRVVLYHGSFAAVASDDEDFDWREEAWETLTHEVRHHVEWRAREQGLEAVDRAAEENYARQAGEPFDPLFFRDGERLGPRLFRVEDDYFLELGLADGQAAATFEWAGASYAVDLPTDLSLPAFLSVRGVQSPPAGELLLVVPRRAVWWKLLRRPEVASREVVAKPAMQGEASKERS